MAFWAAALPWIKTLGPAVLSLAGSAFGASKGSSAAKLQMAHASQEAQLNRDFQERMSNTAYQRAAKDLEAAGLNRVLALGSAASTPGGSMAPIPDFSSARAQGAAAGGGAIEKALAARLAVANVATAEATAKQIAQTTLKTQQETRLVKEQADLAGHQKPYESDKIDILHTLLKMLTDQGFQSEVGHSAKEKSKDLIRIIGSGYLPHMRKDYKKQAIKKGTFIKPRK